MGKLKMDNMIENKLQEAEVLLRKEKCSFVLIKSGCNNTYSKDIGLKPIMIILRQNKMGLADGVVADKVIGKAAALMLVLSKAKAVHGVVMSETAVKVLEEHGIVYTYDTLVPFIENRTKTGACPLEKCVENICDPTIAFDAIEETIAELMKK